jgi:alanyl-tRNA synthetase
MKSSEIRDRFLKYFERQGHTIVSSSALIPGNDPTLLFTNAGMVQFKDVFLGQDKRPYVRATSSQRCVRAGGKHNDLENVGYTARHHTFFEMLGNFSFGDYFKRDAIRFGWEFLTGELKLPVEKLWVTVYAEDDEAANIWLKEVGVAPDRLIRIATSDNFWQMGDTGPCGPCTEIFYDHGPEIPGGPPGSPDADGDRYIEIWNLVFMQYNRDEAGVLHPLPKPSVDTGMGLERISAVMQGVHSNYEIDLFQALIKAAARATGNQDLESNSLKVIADHIRACSFLVCDGVIPSNEGRGYVLRRIIRRAIRHGYKLGQSKPFFYSIVADLAEAMGAAYPELLAAQAKIADVLKTEEERFAETLEHGMGVLEAAMKKEDRMLDGETVFRLYDTFGFPIDLTADIARERGFNVDLAGFEQAMEQQRDRARAAGKFTAQGKVSYEGQATDFQGYDSLQVAGQVLAIYKDGSAVNHLSRGEAGVIVLDRTPFYAESGGQVGDQGELVGTQGTFTVSDTLKIQADVFGHHGVLETGTITLGDHVESSVNASLRERAAYNHSATHLLHAALRKVLGDHVAQKGSLVDATRTRFDFSHGKPLSAREITAIEQLVNQEIRRNHPVDVSVMHYDDAIKKGAMALFGEKYGDEVRVIKMGEFSTELCGGTHVHRSGDMGVFRVIGESGVAAGIRRIEATTGESALTLMQHEREELLGMADLLKSQPNEIRLKLGQTLEHMRALEKELTRLKSKMAASDSADLVNQAIDVNGVKLLVATLPGADNRVMRETLDALKSKLGSAAIVLASDADGKVALIAGVTEDLTARIKAGELVNHVATQVGGKGGGRPDMAQAGGTDLAALPAAMASVSAWIEGRA